jgi:hypothetical protein
MLTLINNKLSIKGTITSADTILKLNTDKDCIYIGVLTFTDNSNKTLNFVKENSYYKTRLLLTEEDLTNLSKCSFHLIQIESTLEQKTNEVTLEFDILKIKNNIKKSNSNEIRDIKINISKLTKRLEDVISKAPSFTVTSATPINTKYVKPGMIPVAIDETGRCIFQYPFIDHVTEINGQKTVNNAILITAKDIPIEQTDVATAIKAHTDAIKELNNLMQTISSELKSTKNKVADIEKALLQHTDSSII